MSQILKFPKGFLWGSATSAYQVEGGIKIPTGQKFIQPAEPATITIYTSKTSIYLRD